MSRGIKFIQARFYELCCELPHQLEVSPQCAALFHLKATSIGPHHLEFVLADEAAIGNIDCNGAMIANAVTEREEPCSSAVDVVSGEAAINL